MSPHSTRSLWKATLLLALTPALRGGDSLCLGQPGERLRARVVPDAVLFQPGTTVTGRLTIELVGAAGALRVVTEGSGSVARGPIETTLDGPWPAGSTTVVEVSAVPVGSGPGEWQAAIDALDDFGAVVQRYRTRLFVDVDSDGTWASGSSDIDLGLRRLDHLRAAGRLSAEQYSQAFDGVTRVLARTDHVEDAPRAATPAEQRIAQAFESFGIAGGQPLSAGDPTVVFGNVLWTDSAGAAHPLGLAHVEARVGNSVVGTGTTTAAGFYAILLPPEAATVSVRVYARSAVADVTPDAENAATYSVDSTALAIASGAQERIDVTIGNTTTVESAFSVHAGMVLIGGYMGPLAGSLPSTVAVRFPTTKHTSLFSSSERAVHLELGDRFDWDVLHHEYGHYVMSIYGFQNNPGGSHSFAVNLAAQPSHDKDEGIRLAWGEGWPTFFGIVGQQRMGGASLGIPNVGDTSFTTTEDSIWTIDIEVSTGLGEDDELTVASCLLDLADVAPDGLDEFQRDEALMFQAFSQLSPKTLGDAWNAFAGALSVRERARAGAVFAHSNAAPEITAPADNYRPEAAPPEFRWKKNGLGNPDPHDDFKVVFWDREFDRKVLEVEVGDTDRWTPTAGQWSAILGGDEVVNWIVEGRNTTAPGTPGGDLERYWSQPRRLGGIGIAFVIDDTESMTEEIGSVQLALQSFITELEEELGPDGRPPTIQVVTFKDSVTMRLVSSDLDEVRSVVDSLTASGGEDCPEEGARAIEFAGENLGQDGVLLFATDASPQPGVNVAAAIAALQAKGVEVQVILSGDCKDLLVVEGAPGHRDARLTDAGFQSWSSPGFSPAASPGRPGDPGDSVDPPQGPLDDEGQSPIDDHGGNPESATLLTEGAAPVLGHASPIDQDFFALDLDAGAPYVLRFESLTEGTPVVLRLLAPDGETDILSVSTSTTNYRVFVPGESGRHFLSVSSLGASYVVGFEVDALAHLLGGVEVYSAIAANTGGVLSLQTGVNDGDGADYVAAMLNIMMGAIRPTVLLAQPNDLPRTASLALSLTGSRTSWGASTTLEVFASGVSVDSLQVLSPTRLVAQVSVDAGATLGFADVVATTPLSDGLELAVGRNVVEVKEPAPSATLLAVQPPAAERGETLGVSLFGAKTSWDGSSTLDLGPDVTVTALDVLSPTRLDATVTIAANAELGFRTPVVNTSGNSDELEFGFLVLSRALEVESFLAVDPPTARRGARLVVSVTAVGTAFVDGVTTADFGPGVDVLATEILSPVRAEVEIEIPINAALGFRDVTLTTGADVFLAEDEFFVEDVAAVRQLGRGLAKLSESLPALGILAFEFDAVGGTTLERLFVVPFGDGANGTVAPPDTEVSLVGPSGAILSTGRSTDAPIDFAGVSLNESGTYRITVVDRGGSGGSYKGVALLAEDQQ